MNNDMPPEFRLLAAMIHQARQDARRPDANPRRAKEARQWLEWMTAALTGDSPQIDFEKGIEDAKTLRLSNRVKRISRRGKLADRESEHFQRTTDSR